MLPNEDKPMNRRRFFRAGFAELLKPIAKAAKPLEQLANQIGKLEDPLPQTPSVRPARQTYSYQPDPPAYNPAEPERRHEPHPGFLRPPGARMEEEFLSVCSRCGDCVRVCPVQCIQLDTTHNEAGGAPFIDPNVAACSMCEGLECMNHCPTGALIPMPREQIDMGTAYWHPSLCLRSHGEGCTMCIDHCPVGPAAIELRGNDIHVNDPGCTGCGTCQHYCPTNPKSITVMPKSARDAHG